MAKKEITHERTFYVVEVDYNGISRHYTSLRQAKAQAHRLAKKLGEGCCINVTADVEMVTIQYHNETPIKRIHKLITSYTY